MKIWNLSMGLLLLTAAGCAAEVSVIEPVSGEAARVCDYASGAMETAEPSAPMVLRAKAADTAANFISQPGQLMAFTANLTIEVENGEEAMTQCQALVKKYQGSVKNLKNDMIVVLIPVNKAEAAMAEFKKLGLVIYQEITADNVTSASIDLDVRIANLNASRTRLLSFLNDTKNVGDLLKVEKELTRITTELETLQSRKKNLQKRVNEVTITLKFKVCEQKVDNTYKAPIRWINALGTNLLAKPSAALGAYSQPFEYTLPAGFMMSGEGCALSANLCQLNFAKYNNGVTESRWFGNEYVSLDFYRPMITETLNGRFSTKPEITETKCGNQPALIFAVKPEIGKKQYCYWLLVSVYEDSVYTVEAYGKAKDFVQAFPEEAQQKLISTISF